MGCDFLPCRDTLCGMMLCCVELGIEMCLVVLSFVAFVLISLCCFVSVWWGFVTFRCAAFFFVLVPVRRVKLRS